MVSDQLIEFSQGFTDLHTESYRQILAGNGFGIEEARSSVNIVHDINNATPVGLVGDYHPMAKFPLTPHPFERLQE
jgi:UDP-N-acetyl-2-amino-2-deoxyglucuronate dehydrogenase